MGTMKPLHSVAVSVTCRGISFLVLALAAIAAGCASTSQSLDIASNERLYVDVPYATRVPGDRPVFVAPLTDARSGKDLPLHDRGFPISYGSDQVWDRPVRAMVDEILARQLDASGLFENVVDRADDRALVLAPSLVKFTTGAVENVGGARSFADVELRVRVFGPVDPSTGKRVELYDENFAERQMTPVSLKPVSPYLLVGRALQATVQKSLAGLDTSNVGRSFVPTQEEIVPGVVTASARQ